MNFKSVLKPEGSVMAGLATIGFVIAVYNLNLGSTAEVQATDANHPAHSTSRKKAGYTALAGVTALTLLTRDANVGILGGGTIIGMEISYRHAIMAHPLTGDLTPPTQSAYQPAEAKVLPLPVTNAG